MDPAPAPTCPRRWEKWYLSPPWGGGYWVSVRCCGVPPPLPPPASVTPRPRAHGCRGAAPPGGGGVGVLAPLQVAGAGAGRNRHRQGEAGAEAVRPSQSQLSHRCSQAPCADGRPSAWGLCKWGATPRPPSLSLPHTCAPAWVFPPGLLWEQPGVGSIPFPQGAGAVAGPRLGLAPFQAPSRHLELGDTGMLGARFTPLQGLEHPRHRWREK